LGQRSCTSRAD